jgi:hypothetical protein
MEHTPTTNTEYKIYPGDILIEREAPVKRCPYCESIYINDRQCEACGRLLDKHFLGEPFGVKSFYQLRANFWHERHPLFKVMPAPYFIPKILKERYRLQLLTRLMALYQYFLLDDEELLESEQRNYFFEELKEVVGELASFGQTVAPLLERLDVVATKLEEKNLSTIKGQQQTLMEVVSASYEQVGPLPSFLKLMLDYKVAGLLSIRFLLNVGLFLFFLSWFCIELFAKLI